MKYLAIIFIVLYCIALLTSFLLLINHAQKEIIEDLKEIGIKLKLLFKNIKKKYEEEKK